MMGPIIISCTNLLLNALVITILKFGQHWAKLWTRV